jgi:hypothetical protein
MWPRMTELAIGAWLLASPWIFGHTDTGNPLFTKDVVCGGLVVALSLLSWWKPTSWAHYFTGLVGAWLGIATWWLVDRPGPPAAQNQITVAVLLLTMFLLPNKASDPPETWREEIARQKRQTTSRRS